MDPCRNQFAIFGSAILALVLSSLCPKTANAQAYRFRTFGIEDGLGNLAVTCVTQSAAGYLWVGTLNGLYRYDGDRFRRYGRGEGLAESEIVSLAAAPDGSVWVATTYGLAVFRKGQFRSIAFDRNVKFHGSSSIAIKRKTGEVWLATSAGVAIVKLVDSEQSNPRARFVPGVPTIDFEGVAFGLNGSVYFAGPPKLYSLQSGVLSAMGKTSGVPEDDWQAIASDADGALWARSPTRLIALQPGSNRFVDRSAGLPPAEFGALSLESNGRIAVPTTHGLARLVRGAWRIVGSRSGLTMDSVSCVFFDSEGTPWIGTNGGGVDQWLGFGSWENWTAPAWVDNDATWSFAEDGKGRIWAGTNAGIVAVPNILENPHSGATTRIHLKSAVRAMTTGLHGELWAGTAHDGLFRCLLPARACRQIGRSDGLPAVVINSLFLDKTGVLWVASDTGLFAGQLQGQSVRFRQQSVSAGSGSEIFRDVAQSDSGEILVAGSLGLSRRRGEKWKRLTKSDGLLDNDLGQVASGSDGSIWISYARDLGVSHLRETPQQPFIWEHFDQKGALISNYIYSLRSDNRHRMWVGTDRGIDSRDGSSWRHYGTDDGLIWPDLNTAALFCDSRGSLWFGTSRGIAHLVLNPEAKELTAPVPIVTQAQVNGRDQDLTKAISIPFRNNEITLHFSALSFVAGRGITYKYRVEGLQEEWRISRERDVHLLHLPPGAYRFVLAAALAKGPTNPVTAKVPFVVQTPFWRTNLFMAVAVLLLLAIVRGVWSWRIRGAMRRQRGLESAVAERTHALTLEHDRLLAAREAFAYQASHDGLTQLANRSQLNEVLNGLLAEERTASILWIDLDRFKAVNDLFGHHMGDLLLQATAGRLKEEAGPDNLAARIGGDEFVLVLACGGEEDACRVAERVLRRLTEPFEIGNQTLTIGASVGIARFPDHGTEPESLLKNADLAMYSAKHNGKGMFKVFNSGLAADIAGKIEIERQLKGVLERNELYVVYQPQVDSLGRMEAVETLVRWSSPHLGTVSPGTFVPLAEETGSIVPIGEWVLRTACEQGAAWHRSGVFLRVAVNVSAVQLTRPDFADVVSRILENSHFDPAHLELEVTETAVMRNMQECIRQMNKLRAMNIRIAVDDFGIGNSSLGYLQLLPVDTLKIDQSFVSSLTLRQDNHASMIRGIVGLAHGLGMRIVAEGVETEFQAAVLREEGCESMQGYFFSRPLRSDAVVTALTTGRPGLLRTLEHPVL